MTRTVIDPSLDGAALYALRQGDPGSLSDWLRSGGDALALCGAKSLIAEALTAPEDKIEALVSLLVAAGADPEDGGRLPLKPIHQAAMANVAALRAIIGAGAELDSSMPNGARALHLCVGRGGEERLSVLLSAGSDPNAPDARGRTALHVAAHAMSPEAVRLLLQAGAQADAPDLDGATPFHVALLETWLSGTRGHTHGPDTKRIAQADLRDCLRQLAEAGCDLNRTDKDGRSAMDLLKKTFSAMEVLEILRS